MSALMDESLRCDRERWADIERHDELARQSVNVQALLDARDGLTGDALADFLVGSCERGARAHLAGDERDNAKIARLWFHVGMLERQLRTVCQALEAVVEPLEKQ